MSTQRVAPLALVCYHAPDGRVMWLRGDTLQAVLVAHTPAEVLPVLAEVERATRKGLYAIGFLAYEAGHGLERAIPPAEAPLPLAWFALFARLEPFEPPRATSTCGLPTEWHSTLSETDYHDAIRRIRDYIAAGDVYQVNYSFRLRTPFAGDPHALFWYLYAVQPVPYAAYLDIGTHAILSLSPELFFARAGEHIVSRPMKGTTRRGLWHADDLQRADELRHSPKNRAENLMIVDMVRNDLGRVAQIGSVHVPALFTTERYATVWQMTATVAARTNASLPELMCALFPAASVTGAPKIRATQIIRELETTPRGIYTGTIGVVLPHQRAQFNVAIRTLTYDRAHRQLEYGVGSGIVWDSDAASEYHECLAKAQILLTPAPPEFQLLETMRWHPRKGYFLLEQHLMRLRHSADYFGFALDEAHIRALLAQVAAPHPLRVRLLLSRDGTARVEHTPLPPSPPLWRVALAPEPIDPNHVFLYHKTTHRAVYERARASCPHCDDVILWNPQGEITESTLANVVVQLQGKLYTPPIRCGLLGGVYREYLLARGTITERTLTKEELARADAIYLINSVRGWMRARLE